MKPKEELEKIKDALKFARPHERKILEIRRDALVKEANTNNSLDEMFGGLGKYQTEGGFNVGDWMKGFRAKVEKDKEK